MVDEQRAVVKPLDHPRILRGVDRQQLDKGRISASFPQLKSGK